MCKSRKFEDFRKAIFIAFFILWAILIIFSKTLLRGCYIINYWDRLMAQG